MQETVILKMQKDFLTILCPNMNCLLPRLGISVFLMYAHNECIQTRVKVVFLDQQDKDIQEVQIQSFCKYLLSVHYVPGTMLANRVTLMSKNIITALWTVMPFTRCMSSTEEGNN